MPSNRGEVRNGGYFTVNTRFQLSVRPPAQGDDSQHRRIYDELSSLETFDRGQMLAVLRLVSDLRPRGLISEKYCRTQIRSMFNCGYIDRV